MSQPNKNDQNPGRKAWRDGSLDPESGDFEQYASRGRELLGSPDEADELLADLDRAIDEAAATDKNSRQQPDQLKVVAVKGRRRWLRPLAIAASLALLLSLGWWLLSDQPELLDRHFVHYDSSVGIRTMGNNPAAGEAELLNALLAYDRKDYAKAITELEAYRTARPDDERVLLYLGLSYLAGNQANKALPLLEEARTSGSTEQEAATFYWALAAKASGSWKESDDDLLRALAESNSLFAQRASALLAD